MKTYYLRRTCASHPRCDHKGQVPSHILEAEKILGRYLVWHGTDNPRSEIVHHINGDTRDNRIENLRVMRLGEHIAHHRKLEALRRRNGKPRKQKSHARPAFFTRFRYADVRSSVAEEFESLLAVG